MAKNIVEVAIQKDEDEAIKYIEVMSSGKIETSIEEIIEEELMPNINHNCKNKLLVNKHIEAIYDNKLNMIHDEYTHILIDQEECSTNTKTVHLSLFKNQIKISNLIEISYLTNYKLVSKDEKGSVVYYKLIMLNEDYTGKGIIKAIHDNSELPIYVHNFDEVQLYAICDGIISWIRLGFSFAVEDSKYLIYENLMIYLETIKVLSDEQLDELESLFLKDDGTIDEDAFRLIDKNLYFLEGNNFTTWFFKQNRDISDKEERKPTMKMYKAVA